MSGHSCAWHLLAKLMIIHVTILSSSFFHAGFIYEAWQCCVILEILSGQVQHKTSELKVGAAVRMVKYLKALHAASPWHPCTEWWLPGIWRLLRITRLVKIWSTGSSTISFWHWCYFQNIRTVQRTSYNQANTVDMHIKYWCHACMCHLQFTTAAVHLDWSWYWRASCG